MKRITHWCNQLNSKEKLLVAFAGNFLYWFFAYLLLFWVKVSTERDTIGEVAFQAIFMGIFWTFLFNWKTVKAAFKKHEQLNS